MSHLKIGATALHEDSLESLLAPVHGSWLCDTYTFLSHTQKNECSMTPLSLSPLPKETITVITILETSDDQTLGFSFHSYTAHFAL